MTTSKICYEQLFPNPYVQFGNIRLWMEINLQEGDTTADAYTKAHKEVNENFNRLFPQGGQPATDFNSGEEVLLGRMAQLDETPGLTTDKEIASCKSIKVLESYRFIVRGNSELEKIYEEKLLELQNK